MKIFPFIKLVWVFVVVYWLLGSYPAHATGEVIDLSRQEFRSHLTAENLNPSQDVLISSERDPDLEPGFPVQTMHEGGVCMSGPVINTRVGNIDSDPQLEIIVSGLFQGPLYAWNHDGTPVPGWPVYFYNRAFYTSLGNLSVDLPGLEIFTGQYLYRVPTTPPGPILGLSGTGDLLPGWPKESEFDVSGPASLADVDKDGLDEIFVYEGRSQIHAYKADGSPLPGWPVDGDDIAHAIADLDGDGDLEVVTIANQTSTGADLIAYHHDGSRVAGFSVRVLPNFHPLPVIGDVDGDKSQEIMILSHLSDIPYLHILVISATGQIERRLLATVDVESCYTDTLKAPALADMDGDSIPEIVLGQAGAIMVWRGDGTALPGFPVIWGNCYTYWAGSNATMVGDVDGDLQPDIIVTNQIAGSSTSGEVYVYDRHGNLHPHFPKTLPLGPGAAPAIADIDLDGRNEIIITGAYWDGYPKAFNKVWVYDLGGSKHGKVEWGQLGGGPQHWGRYPLPPLSMVSNLYVSTPNLIRISPDPTFDLSVRYGNLGLTTPSTATLTAILYLGLEYMSDTSGISPIVSAQSVVWELSSVDSEIEKQFELTLRLPPEATTGDHYTVDFLLATDQVDADPANNSATLEIILSRQIYLPLNLR